MRVAVTGASGFVGGEVVEALQRRGHRVVALSRNPERSSFGSEVEARRFDPGNPKADPAAFAGADAVIHLAGESVAGRWSAEKKQAIYESRIGGTRAVVESLAALEARPSVLVSASASGYYGSRGDEPLFEGSAAGNDFLATVCADWEDEAAQARSLGIRVATIRTGVALGKGGALGQMLTPFRLGAGGPFGSGRQFVPWIHVGDLAALYAFAVEHAGMHGPINGVAPDYATSARFAQALGGAVGMPAVVPAPSFALRAILGEFAQTLVASQLMLPAVAEDAGFSWRHPTLEEAMIAAVAPPGSRRAHVRRFEQEEFVAAPLEAVFAFFSDAHNLAKITPAKLAFTLTSAPARMARGSEIDYRLRVRGIPAKWKTLIASWNPPHGFVDVQLHGPYAFWRHEHSFEPADGGVRIRDVVTYALPFAPFGDVAATLVGDDIRAIFDYRAKAIGSIFAAA